MSRKTRKALSRPLILALLSGLIIITAERMLETFISDRHHLHEKAHVLNHLSETRAKLEGIINSNLLALQGLTAVISTHPDIDQDEFSLIASQLVGDKFALRNIAAAPDLIISMIYPMEGNEKALGLNYRSYPSQKQAVMRAVETGQMVLAGPLELVQGGLGVIARAPVFEHMDNGNEDHRFWGLVSSVIDAEVLFKKAGLDNPDQNINIAIRGADARGKDGKQFFGDEDIFNLSPLTQDVTLPYGSWQMAGIPNNGWSNSTSLIWVSRIGGFLLALLVGSLIYGRMLNNINRVKAAHILAESESRLKEAQEVAHLGSWEFDLADRTLIWSPEVYRIFGFDPGAGNTPHRSFFKTVHPEDRDLVRQAYTESVANHTPYDFDHRLLLNGEIKYVNQRCKTIYDETGKPLRSIGTTQDITERRHQELEMERLHAMLNALVMGSSDCIFIKDKNGRYLIANQAISKVVEKSIEEIIGADDFDLFPDELAQQFQTQDASIIADNQVKTYEELINSTTATVPFLTTKGPLIINNEIKGVFGIARDITALKNAEDQIKQSLEQVKQREAELETVFQSLPDLFFRIQADGTILDYRAQKTSNLYVPPESFLGKRMQDVLPPEPGKLFLTKRDEVLKSGQMSTYEYDLTLAQGKRRFEARLTKLADSDQMIAVVRDVTSHHQAEQALRESEERFRDLYQKTPMMMHAIDPNGILQDVSNHWLKKLGYKRDDVIGKNVMAFQTPESIHRVKEIYIPQLQKMGQVDAGELEFITSHGEIMNIEISSIPELNPDGSFRRGLSVLTDITQSKKAEERLRQSATVFESTSEGVIITDQNSKIVDVNRAFTDVTGYSQNEVIGKSPDILQSGRHDPSFFQQMWISISETGNWRGEVWNRAKDGNLFPVWLNISAVHDENGDITNYVGVFSDISNIKSTEKRLEYLAHHDPLTDLPNRLLLNARLSHALEHAERSSQYLAVLFLDLDRFKNINDSLGHPTGDELLKQVAERLRLCVRTDDTVARIGGDEFVVLLETIMSSNNAAKIAKKILLAFTEPFEIAGRDHFVGVSIGISVYPHDGKDHIELLRNADAAMYQVKERGRNGYFFYEQQLTDQIRNRIELENELHKALERDELTLHYQPQVNLDTGLLIGAEALLRWEHPKKGMIPPGEFIPLAEESGMIIEIGEWVLQTACAQAKNWLDEGLDIGRIAVNIAGQQIQRGNLQELVQRALKSTGLPVKHLELEVTEGFIMENVEQSIEYLEALKQLGVTLAIDDFGTGYSSLSYLKRFPIDMLKIDRSFVKDIPEDSDDIAITRAIISLGANLGLFVIAEGVETEEQRRFLLNEGCSLGQGYFFNKPMPVDDFFAWANKQRPSYVVDLNSDKQMLNSAS